MLNVGQVVYDITNHRVIFFGGVEMLESRKTGDVWSEVALIDEEGKYTLYGKDAKRDIEYTNISYKGKPWVGSAVKDLKVGGCYFGVLAECEEVLTAAKAAIAETKALIEKHGGLRVHKAFCRSMDKVYPVVDIKG